MPRSRQFGDYQTPADLAEAVCRLLKSRISTPAYIVEPTCGIGNLLCSAVRSFPQAERALGVELHAPYVEQLRRRVRRELAGSTCRIRIEQADFFQANWQRKLTRRGPVLVLGNPPWICNAAIGAVAGNNLPDKERQPGLSGLAALTGKSNFDISEWMIRELISHLPKEGVSAMLCKTSVARRILLHQWKQGAAAGKASLFKIEAQRHFGAAVDACLFVFQRSETGSQTCPVYESLDSETAACTIGFDGKRLVADQALYEASRSLRGSSPGSWRSGIKHDCRSIMELERDGGRFRNGLGELVELDEQSVWPLLKTSRLARGETAADRCLLLPQTHVGQDTRPLEFQAPRTWAYLVRHQERLAARKSSIYRGRPPFSIFGIGDYSFAQWKVAISNLHKQLRFVVVGPCARKPTVLEDTACFHACRDQSEAEQLCRLLNEEPAQAFLRAFIFWDAKRPVTIELLELLDIEALQARPSPRS